MSLKSQLETIWPKFSNRLTESENRPNSEVRVIPDPAHTELENTENAYLIKPTETQNQTKSIIQFWF